jgi:pimeloyl-ACP methyl ester carboxylesterase
MQSIEATFESQGLHCAGTLTLPANADNPPVIVMAHGFACVRAMNLPDLAERFVAAGYATFLFDYRNFGDSEGLPRHWVDPKRHQQDWLAAIEHLKTLPQIDTTRIVLWGTSLSGGHVLTLASQGIAVQAVIAQFPHVSGLATLARLHPLSALKLTAAGVLDWLGSKLFNWNFYRPVVGRPGEAAGISSPDAWEGLKLILSSKVVVWENKVLSRVFLKMAFFNPIHLVRRIQVPTLVLAGRTDAVTPASAALKAAMRIPRGKFVLIDCNHFEQYVGRGFEENATEQLGFLREHVPV